MNVPMRTKASFMLAVIAPICVVGVFIAKVGTGNGVIYPMALMFFVPFAIGAGLAWCVKEKPVLSWIVLLGIVAVAVDGIAGLYSAFLRVPARGGQDLIFRPFEQIRAMLAVAVIVVISILTGAIRRRREAKLDRKAKQMTSRLDS